MYILLCTMCCIFFQKMASEEDELSLVSTPCSILFPTPTVVQTPAPLKPKNTYRCSGCNSQPFSKSSNLKRHLRTQHPVEVPSSGGAIKCTTEGCQTLLMPETFDEHFKTVHRFSFRDSAGQISYLEKASENQYLTSPVPTVHPFWRGAGKSTPMVNERTKQDGMQQDVDTPRFLCQVVHQRVDAKLDSEDSPHLPSDVTPNELLDIQELLQIDSIPSHPSTRDEKHVPLVLQKIEQGVGHDKREVSTKDPLGLQTTAIKRKRFCDEEATGIETSEELKEAYKTTEAMVQSYERRRENIKKKLKALEQKEMQELRKALAKEKKARALAEERLHASRHLLKEQDRDHRQLKHDPIGPSILRF